MMRTKVVADVSDLPTYGYGEKAPLWWGMQFFMIIEGLGFIFGAAVYLYLYNQNETWPLGPQLKLLWPSIFVSLMLLSEIPNTWLKKKAKEADLKNVILGMVVMSTIGIIALGIRAFELHDLNIVRWDANAYGSINWVLIGLHTAHLLTDLAETIVMTVSLFIGPVDMRRFTEVVDNQDYWHFIVGFSIFIYTIVYWFPRWLEVAA
jgi:cytochrome c oxidase subunit III